MWLPQLPGLACFSQNLLSPEELATNQYRK
jgi:hypothetical protein